MSLLTGHQLGCRLNNQWVLRSLQMSVQSGERIAVVGANGSGKTTLLRLIHGLQTPHEGQLIWSHPVRKTMLFQRPHMMRCRVRHQVALSLWLHAGASWKGSLWRECQDRALALLNQAGLNELSDQPAHTLSTGQRQILAFALALAGYPDVLLLDEPTANLDPHAKKEMELRIETACRSAQSNTPLTLIFSSHNLGQVKRLATRVWYLERGRLCADLKTEQFFNTDLSDSHPEAHFFLKVERA